MTNRIIAFVAVLAIGIAGFFGGYLSRSGEVAAGKRALSAEKATSAELRATLFDTENALFDTENARDDLEADLGIVKSDLAAAESAMEFCQEAVDTLSGNYTLALTVIDDVLNDYYLSAIDTMETLEEDADMLFEDCGASASTT